MQQSSDNASWKPQLEAVSSPRINMQVAFDEPQLLIVLPGHEHVHVPTYAVKCMSACACSLPADAADWDLSGLLIDGQPVSLDIVKAWLGAVYKQLGDGKFAMELDDSSRSMAGLYQLLRFADAVGSRQGVYQACLAHVDALQVQVPCKYRLQNLLADGRIYSIQADEVYELSHEHHPDIDDKVADLSSDEAIAAVKQAVGQQVEQLLWLAYKLQAASLITSLHTFIHSSVVNSSGLLYGCLGSVFTPRVLEAALGPCRASGARQWINSIVAQPAAIGDNEFRGSHEAVLLKPLMYSEDATPWCFQAQLTRRYLGMPAGTQVDVELDLGSGVLSIGKLAVDAQLLLGPPIHDASDEAALMGS